MVVAAAVSAVASVINSERRIAADNIIQERKAWRGAIRDLTSEINQALGAEPKQTCSIANVKLLGAKFSLLLNPHDEQDKKILDLISQGSVEQLRELNQRIALLLKHDWERAKLEASWRWIVQKPPWRARYEDHKLDSSHDYRRWRYSVRWVLWCRSKLAKYLSAAAEEARRRRR
jgi:hypothetical protein